MKKNIFYLGSVSLFSLLTACTTAPNTTNKPTVKIIRHTAPTVETPVNNSPVATDGAGIVNEYPKNNNEKPSVLVIGGGLSGLTSAYELENSGYQVEVFEARSRLGGRVVSKEFGNGQIAEGGAELIDEKTIHPLVHNYVNKFGLQLAGVGYSDEKISEGAYYINGKLFGYDDLESVLGKEAAADEERFWEELYELGQKLPDATKPQAAPDALVLDAQSASTWVKSLALHPEIEKLALHHIRSEYGEPDNLSLLFLAQQQKAYEDIEDEEIEIYRVAGGNSQLVNGFVKNIKGSLHLNSPVVSLSQNKSSVTATTVNGKNYQADYAVVSVPAKVMNKISFQPQLPEIKQKAVNEITYGHHNKALLQYRTRFWLKRNLGGDTLSELPVGWVWEATDQQKGDAGVLVTYTSGKVAEQEKDLTDYEIITKRQKEIETMYPEAKGQLIDSSVYRWNKSPWLQGGFTAYSPNQVVPFWDVFKKPVNRIYFAGEHTDNLLPGYMEGAIRSGQRAAVQIISADSNASSAPESQEHDDVCLEDEVE